MELITADMPVDLVRRLLCGGPAREVPSAWREFANVQEAYRQGMAAAVRTMPAYPTGKYAGSGVVIVGGGKYFASTYVSLRMLRHVGLDWPVEVWHLGKDEMAGWQRKLLSELGAECVDALEGKRPLRILKGWELKVLAVLHSRFERVLYLDADSYPCREPGFLFEDRGFRECGAMFFPDAPRMKLSPRTWEIMGVPFRDEPTIESGQFLIDKKKCWRGLALTHWMNQRSDYYYHIGPRGPQQEGEHRGRGVHGDKDTFHLAWRYLGMDYAMPANNYVWIPPAVVQLAPDGQPVFIHRARRKFQLGEEQFSTSKQWGPTYEPRLPLEDVAHGFLEELRKLAPRE